MKGRSIQYDTSDLITNEGNDVKMMIIICS
jgi:hypothetical protein